MTKTAVTKPAAAAAKKKVAAAKKPVAALKKLVAAKKKVAAARKPAAKTAAAAAPKPGKPEKPEKKSTLDNGVERLRKQVHSALEELKAKDVTEIDVRGKTSIADLFVLASGTSTRHVKSIADEVIKFAKRAGNMPIGVEGQREAEWVLVDLGDIIVHVMLPRVREFYGLERLWTVGDSEPAPLMA